MLIRGFAEETLKARRLGTGYLHALSGILAKFAEADTHGTECRIARRGGHFGTEMTVRTLQAQMLAVGLLVRETRSQGHRYVGDVFLYAPRSPTRYRKATPEYLEKCYRENEGQRPCPALPSNLNGEDVPF